VQVKTPAKPSSVAGSAAPSAPKAVMPTDSESTSPRTIDQDATGVGCANEIVVVEAVPSASGGTLR